MKKLLTVVTVVLIALLALYGVAFADDIPIPAFSFPAEFNAGEPIMVTFPEGINENYGATVKIFNAGNNQQECFWWIYKNNLDNNTVILMKEGLDAGEYRVEVRGARSNTETSDFRTATFSVSGTRPGVPTVEIISNNAPVTGENEIKITSPGITGFILNVYYGTIQEAGMYDTLTSDDTYALSWTQISENEISVRLKKNSGFRDDYWYTVSALVGSSASRFTEDAVRLVWQEAAGKAILPTFSIPGSLFAGEPLVLQFGGPFDENIWVNVSLYKDGEFVDGSSFCSSSLDENYTEKLVHNGLDSGEYQVEVYAEQEGYQNSDAVTYILTVTGERPAVPALEIVKNDASSVHTNEIRITGEDLDSFILYADYYDEEAGFRFNGPLTEYEMTWTRVSDSEILVQVYKPYGSMSAVYSAAAGVEGCYSRRSAQTVTLSWQQAPSAPAQDITWQDNYQVGEPVIVTLERKPNEDERIFINVYEAGSWNYIDYIMVDADSDLDDDLNVTLFADGLPAGSYNLGIHFDKDDCESTYVPYPSAFTVGEMIVDEGITITVSDEELYTGNEVTVTASNPEAVGIRIYRKEQNRQAEIVAESEDTSCEYSVIYNSASTVQFWAEACYEGEWSGVYSEVKTVSYISRGRLDAPTFDCGTQFTAGAAITVTRTNHVSNEETCLLFLSTPDHSRTLINGLSFEGEDTLTISAPEEAGEYVLSVLVMAPGWTNNYTDLTIYVTGGSSGSGEQLILSENLQLSDVETEYQSSGNLIISGTINGPSDVAEVRIASWQNYEPTANDAQQSAEYMVSIWKKSTSAFQPRALPFSLRNSCPVRENDLGKPRYVILAAMDTEVNLVGYAVIKADLPGTTETKEIVLSVTPEHPVLGQPVTVSWDIIGYEDIEDAYLDVMLFSGSMIKYVDVPYVDLAANRTGSVTFTPTDGETMVATIYFWSGDDYVDEDTGSISLSGEWDAPEPIAVSVSYEADDQNQITATYEVTGGAGSYEFINATWIRLGTGGNASFMHSRRLESPSGQVTYTPPASGEYALRFDILDQNGWGFVQGVNTITNTVTVSGVSQQELGIDFYDGLPATVNPGHSLEVKWDVTGGNTGDYRETAVRIVTDDGIVLEETTTYEFTNSCLVSMSGVSGSSRSVIISLTPMDSTATGETVTVTIPIYRPGNEKLVLPRNLTTIETEAFLGVAASEIDIPDSVVSIGTNAFPGGVTLIVGSGSYAETWAVQNGYTPVIR
ncbi:MAG: hypothetical protein IJI09_10685 [Clostridia bacterium]|nr:hypothetical protein [Clostridia bacterium]